VQYSVASDDRCSAKRDDCGVVSCAFAVCCYDDAIVISSTLYINIPPDVLCVSLCVDMSGVYTGAWVLYLCVCV
jgi:hypothetical protein